MLCAAARALAHLVRGLGLVGRLGRERHVEHAAVDRAANLEAARPEHLQHTVVLAEHVGLELVDAVRLGEVRELLEKERGDASPLVRVGDGEGHLGAARLAGLRRHHDVAGHADDALLAAFEEGGDQRHVVDEVELREAAELGVGQAELGAEEAKIHGARAEAPEVVDEPRLVVRPDGA